ncbi:CheR family methyltransferase [Pedobacter sp. P351]|uniref:CheR family methyltransferase n=1 Tax=Pedobacter superstes TaxID=3133441 RepID=UPI003099DB4F
MPNAKKEKSINSLVKKKSNSDLDATGRASFAIVGMGGSAGSFHAFENFFLHMPADSGMAFVIIMHLDPNHKGRVYELIQNFTTMPVLEARDGLAVEPDKVYMIPPNKDMGIHNGKLLLLKPAMPNGYRLPIDYFFKSLAEDQWNRAVGIVFSGMGSDGETGLRMIKEKLGIVIVQEPGTAQYDSMPRAAINTSLADFILPPEEMPIKLIQFLNHPLMADEVSDEIQLESKDTTAIHKILMLLRSHTGHDFTQYKKSTVTRRIDRRVAYHQLSDYGHYVNYLREHPHELDVLFHELLIGVTRFFRDSASFEALTDHLLPLLRSKPDNEPIRIWVAGCSTGEEAYSISIIVMEYLESLKSKRVPKVQIFATDLDLDAVEFARVGIYHGNIVADISEDRIERFFIKKNDTYQVKKELREMIVFAQHNIIKDAPFTRLDLLSCRNVMIYLTAELQKKIIPIFHYSLNPKGILFQGPAETIGGFTDMFVPLDTKWKIFERKDGLAILGKMIDFPFNVSRQPLIRPEVNEPTPKKKTLADTFSKILLENYTPASILVNEKGDIVYINGKLSKFLELNSGEAVMNVFRMAREELKYVVSNAIHQARLNRSEVKVEDVKLKEDSSTRLVTVKVKTLDNTPLHGLILLVFEDKGILKKAAKKSKTDNAGYNVAIEELEKDLIYTKQQLHNTVEQMETSLEELKSTNEELQSTNEELQSTNEEALTTKEEMQSLNEELMTINVQYQSKGEELTQVNNDMKNMLDNTEIGTIFLNNNLDILRYTPQIKKIFNVIPTDLGRSITHIVSNFDNSNIEQEIKDVIDTLSVKELEVQTKQGEWFSLRIMPYRTTDNFISGAVLTINKITSFKQLQLQVEALSGFAEQNLNAISKPALLTDKTLNIISGNLPLAHSFNIKQKELGGKSFSKLVHEKWENSKLDKFLKDGVSADNDTNEDSADFSTESSKLKISLKRFVNKNTKETSSILIVIDM